MKLNEIIYISFRIQGASSFNVLLVYHRRDKRKKNARPLVLLRKENQKQRLFLPLLRSEQTPLVF